jgi:hypothetical protein
MIDLRATICMISRAVLRDSTIRTWPVHPLDMRELQLMFGDDCDRLNGLVIEVREDAARLPCKDRGGVR